MILVLVRGLECHKEFYVSIKYGANGVRDRKKLWDDLRSANLSIANAAWVQLGDYNVIRRPNERLVGWF